MGRLQSAVSGLALGQTGPCPEPPGPAKEKIVRRNPARGVECGLLGAKREIPAQNSIGRFPFNGEGFGQTEEKKIANLRSAQAAYSKGPAADNLEDGVVVRRGSDGLDRLPTRVACEPSGCPLAG